MLTLWGIRHVEFFDTRSKEIISAQRPVNLNSPEIIGILNEKNLLRFDRAEGENLLFFQDERIFGQVGYFSRISKRVQSGLRIDFMENGTQ